MHISWPHIILQKTSKTKHESWLKWLQYITSHLWMIGHNRTNQYKNSNFTTVHCTHYSKYQIQINSNNFKISLSSGSTSFGSEISLWNITHYLQIMKRAQLTKLWNENKLNDDWQEYVGVPQDFCYFISNFLSTHSAQSTVNLEIPYVSVLVEGPTQNHISDMSVTYKKYLQNLPNFKTKCMSWTSFIYTCTVLFVTKGAQTGTKKWKCLIFKRDFTLYI